MNASLRTLLLAAAAMLALAGLRVSTAQPANDVTGYVYATTLGTTDTPWQRSNAYLNQPWGLGADRDGVWVANAAGRNLVRFGTGPVEELGRAGSLTSLYGRPARWTAEVAVAYPPRAPGQPPTPTPTPDPDGGPSLAPQRTVWFTDEGADVVVGIPLDPYGRTGKPILLGVWEEAGDDAAHFDGPEGVAADPYGNLYVADSGNHRIQVFGPDLALLATLGQPGQPGAGADQLDQPARLAIGADNRLYVADSGNDRVLAFDIKDPRAPRLAMTYGPYSGADALDGPIGVAVDATFVYVADSAHGRVQVLQKTDGKRWRTLDGADAQGCGTGDATQRWDFVSDVALDETGNVYVALPRRMQVLMCDAFDRHPRTAYGAPGTPYGTQDGLYNAPAGLAVAADGTLALVELDGDRAVNRDAAGLQAWAFGQAGVAGSDDAHLAAPSDIAMLSDGRYVLADRDNGRLMVLDGAGSFQEVWGAPNLDAPEGLAVLAGDRLAVADGAAGRVRLFDAGGRFSGDLADASGQPLTFGAPADVAMAGGTWFVSDRARHVVYRYDASMRPLAPLGEADRAGEDFDHFDTPRGLALDSAGRLFVADSLNHRVQVFAAGGRYLTTLGGVLGNGTGGMREPYGVAIGPDDQVFVADTFNHRVQVFNLAAEPWVPDAANGFARRANTSVGPIFDFDGRLYAGASSLDGASVWRTAPGGPWEAVTQGGFGDAGQSGITALSAYRDRLYAGTEHRLVTTDPSSGAQSVTSRGGELWRSTDGAKWDRVAQGGFGDAANAGVSSIAEYSGQLYAGTRGLAADGAGAQVWRSPSGDAASWQRVHIELFTRTEWVKNGAISAMLPYSHTLVAGTCATGGGQVWSSADGAIWRPIGLREADQDPRDATPQIGGAGTACVTTLVEYDGYLYAGLGNEPNEPGRFRSGGAAEVQRCKKCDGTDWDPASSPGLGERLNTGRVALAAYDEAPFHYLYLAVGNVSEGLQIWRSPDGLDWEPLIVAGLGDDNNVDVGAGGAMAVWADRLHLGTRNLANGGELWSSAGTRPGVVPTRPGPTATATPRPSPQPPVGRARYHKAAEWPMAPAAPPDVLGTLVDAAVADDGTVYLLDSAPVRIERLLAGGSWGESFGGSGSGPDRLTLTDDGGVYAGLAVDSAAGRVYAADLGTERVVVYDLDGRYIESWPEIYAVDIDVRPDGSLWVADLLAGAIRHLAADGSEVERFGQFGPQDENGWLGLTSAIEDPGGRLWVADQGGTQLRAYERGAGGVFGRVRTINFAAGRMYAAAGCDGTRLQALADNIILAGPCVIESGHLEGVVPANHAGSDLYGVTLRTANLRAKRYYGVATYDIDRLDNTNETFPSVVRYFDDGFDIVTGSWRGRVFDAGTADPNAIQGPVRLSTAPDGSLYLTDGLGLRRFSPDGQVLETLGMGLYPSRGAQLNLDPRLSVGTGQTGMVVGVGNYTYGRRGQAQMVVYGRSVRRRYCQAGTCEQNIYLEPIWDTTLMAGNRRVPTIEYNYAVAYEATKNQFLLLQLYIDNPSQIEFPARLFLFPIDGQGRKTEVPLEGYDRMALWTDVDAGPDGRIYVLDTLRDFVQVLDATGKDLGRVTTPKDAWRVAGGPNGEIYVLTTYGHVVRMSATGTVLSRFVGLPNDLAPFTAQVDLAVDAWGRVFVADNLYQQVTVFEAEGTEDDVLVGAKCTLNGDKWVTPGDILLGNTAELFLALFGSCGFQEEPSDIVLAVNGSPGAEQNNLRVSRQILSQVDLDRHRVGILSFVTSGNIEAPLTYNREDLIRALLAFSGPRPTCGVNTMAALRTSLDVFQDTPGRRQVLIIVDPDEDPQPGECSWDVDKIAASAAELKAKGIVIVVVNGPAAPNPPVVAASSEVLSRVQVAARGQGVGRPALRRTISRRWPDVLVRTGTLKDTLPSNIDYVPGSANPPATWDAGTRTLTWQLADLPLKAANRFSLRIKPAAEGLWPTNVEAVAEAMDGWGNPVRAILPIPKIRVYGPPPPTRTPTPTRTATPTATPTPRPTSEPRPIFLPIALKTEACKPGSRNADVAMVIDSSGSMSETTSPGGPKKIDAARDAARAFMLQLVAGRDQAALIQFNNEATVLVPLTPDINAAIAGLGNLTQATGTRIDKALDAAVGELTGPSRQPTNNPVIILLTDGEPTGTTPEEVLLAADRAHRAGMLVFTIGLGQAVDHDLMMKVASKPEWYFFAPDTSDLAGIYAQIAYAIPCEPEWP